MVDNVEFISRSDNCVNEVCEGTDGFSCKRFTVAESTNFCGYCNDPPRKHKSWGKLRSQRLDSERRRNEKTQMSSTPTHQFQCLCCSHKHLVFYPEGNAGFRWKISMGKHSSWVDWKPKTTVRNVLIYNTLLPEFYKRRWDCNSILIQVSIFFGKEKEVGAVGTTSKVGKNWTSLCSSWKIYSPRL